jgi:hypothetical protein
VYRPDGNTGCLGGPSWSGYGSGAVGGAVGGAGNVGMGGGREMTGWLELPAESVRGGGLLEASSLFWMRSGPMVGVSGVSPGRRKSSSSGRPCLRPSIAIMQQLCRVSSSARSSSYFWELVQADRGAHCEAGGLTRAAG